jgi:Immunity protein 50
MWTAFLENPEAITSVFDTEPSLDDVYLYGIELLEDGPTVNFKIRLKDYPQNPPARWKYIHGESNTVVITLRALGINRLDISGWSTENFVSCKISRTDEEELSVVIKGNSTEIDVMCDFLRVTYISAYIRRIVSDQE